MSLHNESSLARKELKQMNPLGNLIMDHREGIIKVCHALLQDSRFFRLQL
ncbi:hypothetical protein NTGHW29_100026 [Candidatus Nitrotoga sp. HW29]|nr:hypothetical protein NTGHW29_100026 [Candidatus Nitrotoga sp. HW29]